MAYERFGVKSGIFGVRSDWYIYMEGGTNLSPDYVLVVCYWNGYNVARFTAIDIRSYGVKIIKDRFPAARNFWIVRKAVKQFLKDLDAFHKQNYGDVNYIMKELGAKVATRKTKKTRSFGTVGKNV